MTPQASASRMRLLLTLFSGWFSADLAGAVAARTDCALMAVSAPGVYVGLLLGREPSWRQAWTKQWRSTPAETLLQIAGADSNDQKLREAAAKIMFSIFVQAFRQWVRSGNMVEERKIWETHVDRNVQRHLTLLTWAQRAGILQKHLGRTGSLGAE